MGTTNAPGSFDSEGLDDEAWRQSFRSNRSLRVHYHVEKMIALYYAGDSAGVLAASERALPLQPGHFPVVEHCFYRALSLAAQCWSVPPQERPALLDALRAEEAKLREWARSESPDHTQRHALIAAELAAILGELDQAAELYDHAISTARSQDALHVVALASELAGEFYLRRGRHRVAQAYLADAHRGYLDWGAQARASRILNTHAHAHARAWYSASASCRVQRIGFPYASSDWKRPCALRTAGAIAACIGSSAKGDLIWTTLWWMT